VNSPLVVLPEKGVVEELLLVTEVIVTEELISIRPGDNGRVQETVAMLSPVTTPVMTADPLIGTGITGHLFAAIIAACSAGVRAISPFFTTRG
jgi:hypothetical protein